MTLLVYFHLVVFILVPCRNAFPESYIPLVVDLHHYYKTSGVTVVTRDYSKDLAEKTYMNKLSRRLSNHGVQTLMIYNNEVLKKKGSELYNRKIPRPLIVVDIKTYMDISLFNERVPRKRFSFPMWLVIFSSSREASICDYCKKVTNNIFGVRFDTDMFVVCCDDPVIREWWHVRNDRLEKSAVGNWTVEHGLNLHVKRNVFTRRRQIPGTEFRLGIVKNSAFYDESKPSPNGFFGDIVKALQRSMNFTISKIVPIDSFGFFNTTTGNFSSAIEIVHNGAVDLCLGEFTLSRKRISAVDFTSPLLLGRTHLYMKPPTTLDIPWHSFYIAIQGKIWILLILTAFITAAFVTIVKKQLSRKQHFWPLFFENLTHSLGIFCQQAMDQFPNEISLRITYISLFILAMVTSVTYSASLMSYIMVWNPSLPFSSFEEFASDGSYRLIVIRDSSDLNFIFTSLDPAIIKMRALLKPVDELPISINDALETACNERVGFIYSDIALRSKNIKIACKLYELGIGRMESMGMILPWDSQYTRLINFHLHRYQDNGVLSDLRMKAFKEPSTPEPIHDPVTFQGVFPIILTLIAGGILSLIIFSFEKVYYSIKKYYIRHNQKRKFYSKSKFQLRYNQHK